MFGMNVNVKKYKYNDCLYNILGLRSFNLQEKPVGRLPGEIC